MAGTINDTETTFQRQYLVTNSMCGVFSALFTVFFLQKIVQPIAHKAWLDSIPVLVLKRNQVHMNEKRGKVIKTEY